MRTKVGGAPVFSTTQTGVLLVPEGQSRLRLLRGVDALFDHASDFGFGVHLLVLRVPPSRRRTTEHAWSVRTQVLLDIWCLDLGVVVRLRFAVRWAPRQEVVEGARRVGRMFDLKRGGHFVSLWFAPQSGSSQAHASALLK